MRLLLAAGSLPKRAPVGLSLSACAAEGGFGVQARLRLNAALLHAVDTGSASGVLVMCRHGADPVRPAGTHPFCMHLRHAPSHLRCAPSLISATAAILLSNALLVAGGPAGPAMPIRLMAAVSAGAAVP